MTPLGLPKGSIGGEWFRIAGCSGSFFLGGANSHWSLMI